MISIYVIRIIDTQVNAVQKMLGSGNMDLITNMNTPCTMNEVQFRRKHRRTDKMIKT